MQIKLGFKAEGLLWPTAVDPMLLSSTGVPKLGGQGYYWGVCELSASTPNNGVNM